jgi:hypothetical protein
MATDEQAWMTGEFLERMAEAKERGQKYIINDEGRIVSLWTMLVADRYWVSLGDVGGRVDGYHNLSQVGRAWIDVDSQVRDYAYVSGDVYLVHCEVFDYAVVAGKGVLRYGQTSDMEMTCVGNVTRTVA